MKPLQPLRPFRNASFFVGNFDESLLPFLPLNSDHKTLIHNRDMVVCKHHVLDGEDKFIHYGEKVVVVKWPALTKSGQIWRTMFYCSLQCQRNHAAYYIHKLGRGETLD